MSFNNEAAFEHALVAELQQRGWGDYEVINQPDEAALLQNWADILLANNSGKDRLNNVPLTTTEMQQIVEQIKALRTPLKLNSFINGNTVAITRDSPDDPSHLGKEVSLHIYDRHAIATGNSRYQIVKQPRFASKTKLLNDRRGDIMLLINGMPVIHIELKRSSIPVSNATNQLQKYTTEGVFTGLFALVQVFVAMNPEDAVYFANPGMEGSFNPNYFFHWADFNNQPIKQWQAVASSLLSIPMAHQLIGFYTVADERDGILKVMRSYQYHAANAISDKIARTNWRDQNRLGGYVWHTTGSGKTLTSFKSAQLIAQSQDADKVVFLMDRIELGTQSLLEYRGFAGDSQAVQATDNTHRLITKLKSGDPANTLIVTSIQKLSNIKQDELKSADIDRINQKRIVFIVDEAHRSTFGDMLISIKQTFTSAVFFGFTGTPIKDENTKKNSTTAMVFGNELHRYSVADGLRDGNVLGFDLYKMPTFKNRDLRREVALTQAKAHTEHEALSDPKKAAIYNRFTRDVPMAGYKDKQGKYQKGIEDYIPQSQYGHVHQQKVVQDIAENWQMLSQQNKFYGLLATHSTLDAIAYYRLFKESMPTLKVTALFDPHLNEGEDDQGKTAEKQAGLVEILTDYNARYEQQFDIASHGKFKKDLAARLAHKKPYTHITHDPDQQLHLLIVVEQMLTGFDSKWINTLYLDKAPKYEHIIQAFSRTNRLFGPEKPFGTIRYYRYPHTMERNIEAAFDLYSGNRPVGLFVDKLGANVNKLNTCYKDIDELFTLAGIVNFERLPEDNTERGKFANLFRQLSEYLEAARIQGFTWDQVSYPLPPDKNQAEATITLLLNETTYLILALRYKELSTGAGGASCADDVPFNLPGYLTEIDTGKIDADYMNSRFDKYLKVWQTGDDKAIQKIVDELHKSFASLTQDQQKYANIFLNDVQRGEVMPEQGKTLRDYITQYQVHAKNSQVMYLVNHLGIDETIVNELLNTHLTETNIMNDHRFTALENSVDKAKAKAFFEQKDGKELPEIKVNIALRKLLKDFLLKGELDS